MIKISLGVAAAAAALATATAIVVVAPSADAATTGTWVQEAPYTTTSSSSSTTQETTTDVYAAQVQQPINPDGSSVWPAKRGVIPVQFTLTQATKTCDTLLTTTTTTKHYTFESLNGHAWPDPASYSAFVFTPSGPMTVADITNLAATFSYTTGQSQGGSLRWSIETAAGTIHVYYGDAPNWSGTGGTGINLISAGDNRFDTSQLGGGFYDTWANTVANYGSYQVDGVALVVDSGWVSDQVLTLTDATVNDNTGTWQPTTASDHTTYGTPVCTTSSAVQTNAPTAYLDLYRTGDPSGQPIDESTITSVQGDTGGKFRQVDGKYIYNLDLKALNLGAAQYKVYMKLNGTDVQNPGVFNLK
jgi:hypothetical protein